VITLWKTSPATVPRCRDAPITATERGAKNSCSAFAAARYDATIAALAPVLDQLVRVGGSAAQRDLFEHTLLAAYLRTGRHGEARALLERSVARPRSVPVAGV